MAVTLLPGERVLWTGSPVRPGTFYPDDAFRFPFSLVWCGFAVAWTATVAVMAIQQGRGGLFVLAGLPFVAAGLVFACWPYLRWRTLHDTVYTVTDKRILVGARLWGRQWERSRGLGELHLPTVEQHPDGTGTITLRTVNDDDERARLGIVLRSVADADALHPAIVDAVRQHRRALGLVGLTDPKSGWWR